MTRAKARARDKDSAGEVLHELSKESLSKEQLSKESLSKARARARAWGELRSHLGMDLRSPDSPLGDEWFAELWALMDKFVVSKPKPNPKPQEDTSLKDTSLKDTSLKSFDDTYLDTVVVPYVQGALEHHPCITSFGWVRSIRLKPKPKPTPTQNQTTQTTQTAQTTQLADTLTDTLTDGLGKCRVLDFDPRFRLVQELQVDVHHEVVLTAGFFARELPHLKALTVNAYTRQGAQRGIGVDGGWIGAEAGATTLEDFWVSLCVMSQERPSLEIEELNFIDLRWNRNWNRSWGWGSAGRALSIRRGLDARPIGKELPPCELTALTRLCFEGCGLSGYDLEKLLVSLKGRKCESERESERERGASRLRLKTLIISRADIGVRGCHALANCPELCTLETLVLTECELTPECISILGQAPHFRNLKELRVSGNDDLDTRTIDRASVPYLNDAIVKDLQARYHLFHG